jgi:glycosyltransferase involved in cell wall biosynthesis
MRFTVMTPTFNRAHTLGGVYESLCAQTFRDFEWVIVDDGSTDGTRELVSSWKPFFPIRYFWQENRGKHAAMNAGVSAAEGEFVLFFDSDDRCIPTALQRFDHHWKGIPAPERFANLSCLCAQPDGAIVGTRYPSDCVDAYNFADQLRLRNSAERWGINRTDVLRAFPWPEGERGYVLESLVWNRMARRYAARFVNEALRIFEPNPNGITRNSARLRATCPKATLLYYRELTLSPAPLSLRVRGALNYIRFAILTAPRRLMSFWQARSA